MLEPAPCHWIVTLVGAQSDLEALHLDELPALLRQASADSTLSITAAEAGNPLVFVAGSWAGYLRAANAFRAGQLKQLGDLTIAQIEPKFTLDYIERIRNRKDNPEAMIDFTRVYGPLLQRVVIRLCVRRKALGMSVDSEDAFFELWAALMRKLESVLEKMDWSKGTQQGWLYKVAKNQVLENFRKQDRIREDLDPSIADDHTSPIDVSSLIERAEFGKKVLAAFKERCAEKTKQKPPTYWEMFQLFIQEERTKEEICKQYGMSPNYFDVRMSRIRQLLWEVVTELADE